MALRILNLWTGIVMLNIAIAVLILGFSFFGSFVDWIGRLMLVQYAGGPIIGLMPLYYIIGVCTLFTLLMFYATLRFKESIIPEGQGDDDMLIDEKGGKGELVAP